MPTTRSILGETDETVSAFFYKALAALVDDGLNAADLVELNMELGRVNFRCMEILDKGNTSRFGHPVPTAVSLGSEKRTGYFGFGPRFARSIRIAAPDPRTEASTFTPTARCFPLTVTRP